MSYIDSVNLELNNRIKANTEWQIYWHSARREAKRLNDSNELNYNLITNESKRYYREPCYWEVRAQSGNSAVITVSAVTAPNTLQFHTICWLVVSRYLSLLIIALIKQSMILKPMIPIKVWLEWKKPKSWKSLKLLRVKNTLKSIERTNRMSDSIVVQLSLIIAFIAQHPQHQSMLYHYSLPLISIYFRPLVAFNNDRRN